MPVPFGNQNLLANFSPEVQARLRGGYGLAGGAGAAPIGGGGAGGTTTPPPNPNPHGDGGAPNPHQGAVTLTPAQAPLSYRGTDIAGAWNGGFGTPSTATPPTNTTTTPANPFAPPGATDNPPTQFDPTGGTTPEGQPIGGGKVPDNSIALPPPTGGQQMPQLFAGGGRYGIGAGMQAMSPFQRGANVAGGKGGGAAPGPGGGGGGGVNPITGTGGGIITEPGPKTGSPYDNPPANTQGNPYVSPYSKNFLATLTAPTTKGTTSPTGTNVPAPTYGPRGPGSNFPGQTFTPQTPGYMPPPAGAPNPNADAAIKYLKQQGVNPRGQGGIY